MNVNFTRGRGGGTRADTDGQFGLPASWSKDCPHKNVKVEIGIEPSLVGAGGSGGNQATLDTAWVEIPTTETELWVNKHGSSDKSRVAKVKFPTTWDTDQDGNPVSVTRLLEPFRPEEGETNITYCRISFRKDGESDWVVKHFGFVGAVGQTGKRGVSKMWVFDFADMMNKIPATINFSMPTAETVMETAMKIFTKRTPARIGRNMQLIGPDGETPDTELISFDDEASALYVATSGFIGSGPTSPKAFYSNRDTLGDVMNWLCDKLNAIWYFKPTSGGVVLVVDSAGTDGSHTRYEFSQPAGDISVIQNNAVYEINPVNTVILKGTASTRISLSDLLPGNEISKEYPVAKVRAQNLYEQNVVASGSEEAGELTYQVDGDATDIDGAVREAKDVLRGLLEKEGAGVIKLRGEPEIEAYDIIESYFTCAEDAPDDVVPLRYEVEEVKHHARAGKIYRTRANVSIFVGEERIVTVEDETYMVDTDADRVDA